MERAERWSTLCLKCQAATAVSERRKCWERGQLKSAQAFGANWGEGETTRLCEECSAQCYCSSCKEVTPRVAFRSIQFTRTREDRKCGLCADSADNQNRRRKIGAPCCHCHHMAFDQQLTCELVYHVETGRRAVMFTDCAAAGRTLRDRDVYACNRVVGCQRVLGFRKAVFCAKNKWEI